MKSKPTMVDLFCGGGGSSTGFHQAGFETKIAVDFEEHCVDTFNANYPDTAILADISTLRAEPLLEYCHDPDFVTASPPCEPYTAANKNREKNPLDRMFTDPVGRLMIDAIRLIADLEPQYFMIENVVGVLEGESRELMLDEFSRVGLENIHFNVVQANQWGVPSQRQRVIITNFVINPPNLVSKRVMDVIGDLPPPNYPTEFEYHWVPHISTKYQHKIPNTPQGEGLVYFPGAHEQMRNFIRLHGDRVAPVVMGKSKFIHPTEDRILTPQEHGRLMSFPDDYKYMGTTAQIYDIIGEAVPPRLTYEIGKQLMRLIDDSR